jgi:hypothetical protein
MKLYREVPPEKGTGLSLHRFKDDFAEPMYKCTLEEIEITEEDLVELLGLIDYHKDIYGGFEYNIEGAAQAIIKHLKNETR